MKRLVIMLLCAARGRLPGLQGMMEQVMWHNGSEASLKISHRANSLLRAQQDNSHEENGPVTVRHRWYLT